MKKVNLFFFAFIIFNATVIFGQVNPKISENVPYQKSLKFEDDGLSEKDAISAFSKEYFLEKGYTFILKKGTKDKMGFVHRRFQQFYNSIKIEFGTLITHSSNERVMSINGELYNASKLNLIPNLTKSEAFQKVLNNVNAQKYLWEEESQSKIMEYKKPEGELVIFPLVKTGEVKLAYKFDVYSIDPISRADIYIDAHTGLILFKNQIIKHANGYFSDSNIVQKIDKFESLVSGNAATRYSGTKSIETTFDPTINKYVLKDFTRGNGIATYNSARTINYQDVNFTDIDNNWTAAEFHNINKDDGALDAHWAAQKTYDFWSSIFGRNSFDDNGSILKSYVHYRKTANANLVNAFWNGSVMSYGDGNTSTTILTSIDVCAHEIGHAICQYTAGLAYQNQSGAMNEGLSDIWGACIEHFGRTGSLTGLPVNAVWQIGEDLSSTGNSLRSMNSPLTKGNPDTYLGTNWTSTGDEGTCVPATGNDYCGVHNNSGVLNHWFYILTAGKSGTNNAPTPDAYSVTGIGMVKSAEIIYLAERDYLTANATYLDARNATLSVASNLYCSTSPEFIATANAWFAVNVGEQYVAFGNDVTLKSLNKNISFSCNSNFTPVIVFENSGANPISSVLISYSIDGGAVTNTSWSGSLTNCSSQSFALPTFSNLSTGTHILSVTTSILNDENATNNTKTSYILANGSGTVNEINTFENPADNLITIDSNGMSNVMWERGLIGTKANITNLIEGSNVYATKLSGNYPDKTKSYLVSKCYDLTTISNPKVEFDMGFDLEPNFDILYVQTSSDGGLTWSNLGSGISSGWYNNDGIPNATDCQNCVGGQWTGLLETKNHYSYDLPLSQNILIRFVMQSDDAVNNDGVFIDNFVITGTLKTNENYTNNFVIFPNPSKGIVNIKLDTAKDVKVSLFDLSGRNIFNKTYNSLSNTFSQDINFNPISEGIYLLNVDVDGKLATKKIIIK